MMLETLPETNAEIARLMGEKLRVGGSDRLEAKVQRGARRLPRKLREQARYLVAQEKIWPNPRLRRTIDSARVESAQAELRRYLKKTDPKDVLMGRILGVLAPLMFNVLMIFIVVVIWLVATDRI